MLNTGEMTQPERKPYEFGEFRVDPSERLLRKGADVVPLPPKAIDTLLVLLENPGRVVGKDELLKRIWPDAFVEEGVLAQNVSLLRKVLGSCPAGGDYIKTVPTRGYRFAAAVNEVARAAAGVRSLLVLPLENLSRDADQEYFADGMTDELISYLMKVEALRVCSRTTAMTYKGVRKPLRQIVQELNVDWVVEGAVVHSDDRVRVSARVFEGATEHQLWAETYERSVRDVLALQSDVASAITREIRVRVTGKEEASLAKSRPVNPAAYEAYLRGRSFWNKRTPQALAQSAEYFRQAIDLDHFYAPAHAGLADAFILMGSNGYDVLAPRETMPRAKKAAKTALEIDETLAAAHTSLANVYLSYDWDWINAELHFKRAIQLNPNHATAHEWYSHYLLAIGRLEEAGTEVRLSLDLDPLSIPGNFLLGYYYCFARKFDQAIDHYGKTLEIYPNVPIMLYELCLAYENNGSSSECLAVAEKSFAISGGEPVAVMLLGRAKARLGRTAEARNHLETLKDMSGKRHVPAFYIACVHAALGERDQAFQWLEKAYEERTNYMIYLNVEPSLDDLRSDQRFQDLVERVGLPRPGSPDPP